MEKLKELAAMTALNKMLADGHFSICTVDSVAAMLNVRPAGDSYNILRTVHCVDYAKMPAELREAIPSLIKECLGIDPFYQFKTMERQVIEVSPVKCGFMRLIGGDK
jgi:hypothetical protein